MQIFRNKNLCFYFIGKSFGNSQEMDKFTVRTSAKSYGYI